MKRKFKILLLTVVVVFGATVTLYPLKANQTLNLMIVAHPDDESIWGGKHLSEGNYYVVCLTSKNNKKRSEEFLKVLKASHNDGIILGYPDKVNGTRDDWQSSEKKMKKELAKMIKSNSYKMIVTHNPEGEYGHIQHIKTSKIVSEICVENKIQDKLYYFGKYVKKSQMHYSNHKKDLVNKISKKKLSKKNKMVSLYQSQKKTVNKLGHMLPYENWIPYQDWK